MYNKFNGCRPCSGLHKKMAEKIIFDCDNTLGIFLKEVDDGLTLLYLLGTPGIEILGLTTTFGNGRIDQVYLQTQKLVQHFALEIPVLIGEGSLTRGQPTPAAEFLVKTVDQYPGEITLLATGPLGNVSTAAQLDPAFFRKVKRIIAMGGYLAEVRLGYRNLDELNFSAHPEATLNVLSAPCPVTIFPAQVCLEAPYHLRNIRKADFWPKWMKRTLTQWLLTFGLYTGEMVFYLWDLLPAVYLSKPELFVLQPFQLGSALADFQEGMLIETHDNPAQEITLARRILDQNAFYTELNRGWRSAVEKYPL
jgi:inosine-uridine nucleoside N-ribohydrolase